MRRKLINNKKNKEIKELKIGLLGHISCSINSRSIGGENYIFPGACEGYPNEGDFPCLRVKLFIGHIVPKGEISRFSASILGLAESDYYILNQARQPFAKFQELIQVVHVRKSLRLIAWRKGWMSGIPVALHIGLGKHDFFIALKWPLKISHLVYLVAFILFFPSPLKAQAVQIKLAWNNSPDPSVIGYKVYYGFSSRTYHAVIDVGNKTTCTISGLQSGRPYYFSATGYNAFGDESEYSNEVFYNLPGKTVNTSTVNDFDGDGATDVAAYNAANGWWFFHYSGGSYGFDSIGVGGGSQWKPVPGDYDGDGKTDVAVYDTVDGWWLIHFSSGLWGYDHIGRGGPGYVAVPGDYDGDGVTDLAVYQEYKGIWFFKYSSGGSGYFTLGGSGKVPVVADYDGDGKADVTVYETATGYWYFNYSQSSTYGVHAIGVDCGSQGTPVPGDYDGDGKADLATYDTVSGWWLIQYSSRGLRYDHIGQGGTGFAPVPGDYDGDGMTDLAVLNRTTGNWFFKYSSGRAGFDSLGGSGYVPVN